MPWKDSAMSQRLEFVTLAKAPDANVRELCRRFDLSPTTAYKWIARFDRAGGIGVATTAAALCDRSRRPTHSPARTTAELEAAVIDLRRAHPRWGGRKIRRRLMDLGHGAVPAASTVTDILRRAGLIDPAESAKRETFVRFEHAAPNDLWQMDFKGHFAIAVGGRCHPLTVLDDHSRYNTVLRACANEQDQTVRTHLADAFRRYGMPLAMLMDNGSPWGGGGDQPHTELTVWLMRLGVRVCHGRPHHPQTQGKEERFHRSLLAEAIAGVPWRDLTHCQGGFDAWRDVYNLQRPHEALGLATPATRYRPSPRAYPETPPTVEYAPSDVVRKVQDKGRIKYEGRIVEVSQAFKGQLVALRPSTTTDGMMDVFFFRHRIAELDLREQPV
jgi:transposase InsO family protein